MDYKISMIIPVYNGGKFIDIAMNSIINQTIGFKNIEVIVIDNNSTDNTPKIIKKYNALYENFKGILLEKNSGSPGTSRNIGIKHATGKYLMFMDIDDIYKTNACEIAYNKITEYNTDVIFYNFYEIDLKTNFKTQHWYNITEELRFNPKFLEKKDILYKISSCPWCKILKKEFITRNNIKFYESIHEDIPFSIKTIANLNEIIIIPNDLYIHYLQDSSLSMNHNKNNIISQINGLKNINYELISQDTFSPSIFMGPYILYWLESFISCYNTLNLKDKKELLEMLYEFENKLDYTTKIPQHIGTILNNFLLKHKFNIIIFYSYLIGIFYNSNFFKKIYYKFFLGKL